MPKIYRLGVVGNPIEHSLSPFIHSRFARNEKINLIYKAYKVEPDSFEEFVDSFFNSKESKGLNITLPFKYHASKLSGIISTEASTISAVNTINKTNNKIELSTTDGVGFIEDLKYKNISIRNKEILIIGAGAASESILYKIISEQPKKILIANRTKSKAQNLIIKYKKLFENIQPYSPGTSSTPDLIINGSSAGLTGKFSPIDINTSETSAYYDLNYSLETTPFCEWALQNSPKVFDGIGMLLNQAAYSFDTWFGVKPETQSVLEDIRAL